MKTKSKGMLIGTIFGIVLAGAGVFGAIKVLNLKVEKAEDMAEKYDYLKVDFTNSFDEIGGVLATKDNVSKLIEKNGTDLSLIDFDYEYFALDNCYLEKGGLRIGNGVTRHSNTSLIDWVFTNHYDNFRLNLIPYNEPIYSEDENGKKTFESWYCERSTVIFSTGGNVDIDSQIYFLKTNNGKLEEPPVTSIEYIGINFMGNEENPVHGFRITDGYTTDSYDQISSRSIILSIEVWNDEASIEVPTEDTSINESITSAVSA